jgi:hypothetical protein
VGRGTLVSIAVHSLLLFFLACWLIERPQLFDAISTRVVESDPEQLELGSVSMALLPDESADETQPPQSVDVMAMLPKPEMEIPTPEFLKQPGPEGSGKGTGKVMGRGKGGGGAPKKAVTKGSFTVWTVPEDPEPGQDYVIVIEIKLPEKLRQYPLKDLSGTVVGTDGWKQAIPGKSQGYARIIDNRTQLRIKVPGAPRLVSDTIDIRSRLLKEQQTLTIVF